MLKFYSSSVFNIYHL